MSGFLLDPTEQAYFDEFLNTICDHPAESLTYPPFYSNGLKTSQEQILPNGFKNHLGAQNPLLGQGDVQRLGAGRKLAQIDFKPHANAQNSMLGGLNNYNHSPTDFKNDSNDFRRHVGGQNINNGNKIHLGGHHEQFQPQILNHVQNQHFTDVSHLNNQMTFSRIQQPQHHPSQSPLPSTHTFNMRPQTQDQRAPDQEVSQYQKKMNENQLTLAQRKQPFSTNDPNTKVNPIQVNTKGKRSPVDDRLDSGVFQLDSDQTASGRNSPATFNPNMNPSESNEPASKRARVVESVTQIRTRELLSETEKRLNHVHSEQRRRNLIRNGFQRLVNLTPALAGGTMHSKSTILDICGDYIVTLREEIGRLRGEGM